MGTSGPDKNSLSNHLVPADELQFAEYVFRLKIFNTLPQGIKRKDHKWFSISDREELWTIVNALANTCGGVIEIQTVSGDPVQDLDLNYLQATLSTQLKAAYKECLTICNRTGRSLLVIRKAKPFITAQSHMFTRGLAETVEVLSHDEISAIVNEPKKEKNAISCLSKQALYINGVCSLAEVKEIEFKQINSSTAVQLMDRIRDTRFERVLFAMPNLPHGGDVIVGIYEDEVLKKYIFRGVELDESDKELIRSELQTFMQVDKDGCARFWGKLKHTDIREGVHWFCHFIPLAIPLHLCDAAPCSICPHKGKKYLINLNFPHFPGGVFLRSPKAFVLNEDGSIEQMQFPDWLKKHDVSEPVIHSHSDYHPQLETLTLQTPEASGTQTPRNHPKSKKKPSEICLDNVTLKFSVHSSHKKPDIPHTSSLNMPEAQHPAKFDLFRMTTPINYTPSKNEIEVLLPDKSILKIIEKALHHKEAFGVAADSLFDLIQHLSSGQRPPHHIMDVLAVNRLAHIILFVICSTFGTHDDQKTQRMYTMSLGRILKMQISNKFNCGHIVVQCHIWALDGSAFVSSRCQTEWFQSECDTNKVCGALMKVLTKIQTHFSEIIMKDADLELSTEQLQILQNVSRNRFNFIEGPPGCGKTLLAQDICKRHGKDKSVYISKSQQLTNLILHAGLIDAKCANTEEVLLKTIQDSSSDVEHIVIDDAQNLSLHQRSSKEILDYCQQNKKTLYVFQDSMYQNFEHNPTKKSLMEVYFKYRTKCHYDGVLCDTLKVIRRNSGIVGSYITALVSDISPDDLVQCASRTPGDDVIVQHVKNLRALSNNGLVAHVQGILSKNNLGANNKHYTIRDVAILVDNHNTEILRKEVKLLQQIFQSMWPDSHVQSADHFPVEGIVVDRLDNFSGMEKRIVIFVLPDQRTVDSVRSLSNPKYKVAIATRGIDRVDFVQEANLVVDKLSQLKFDKISQELLQGPQGMAVLSWTFTLKKSLSDLMVLKPSGKIIVSHSNTSLLSCLNKDGDLINMSIKAYTSVKIWSIDYNTKTGDLVMGCTTQMDVLAIAHYNSRALELWSDPSFQSIRGDFTGPPIVQWASNEQVVLGLKSKDRTFYLLLWNVFEAREVKKVWTSCKEVGDMSVADTDGTLYVCDLQNHNIHVYNTHGDYNRKFVLNSPDPDYSLSHPYSVSAVSGGRVLVCHRVTDTHKRKTTWSVTLWSLEGKHISDVVTDLPHGGWVLLDEYRGLMFLTDQTEMTLMKYDITSIISQLTTVTSQNPKK